MFSKQCAIGPEGEFIVSLLFRIVNAIFNGVNDYAIGRFYKLETSSVEQPEIYQLYKQVIFEYLDL